jgi:hypothetical protein
VGRRDSGGDICRGVEGERRVGGLREEMEGIPSGGTETEAKNWWVVESWRESREKGNEQGGGTREEKEPKGWQRVELGSRRWRGRPEQRAGCRAEKQSSARGGREREFLEDLFVILENCRDLLVKKN